MGREVSTAFESAADMLLTETVKVIGRNRIPGKAGSVAESAAEIITGLRCSIQPRSSLDARTILGRLPDMSHMLYCRGEDSNGTVLDAHKGDEVQETTSAADPPRRFTILTEPERYPDFETGGVHHLEMELRELLYG